MDTALLLLSPMFQTRLIQYRKAQNLTQQALADAIGMHVNQIKRYEAGTAQPNLDALVRLAKVLHVSLDALVFDESERSIIKALLDGMIVKYQTQQIVGNLGR